MGKIETTVDNEKKLTIARAIGKMETREFIEWIANVYGIDGEGSIITSLLIWDLREADMSAISANDMKMVAQEIKIMIDVIDRPNAKTAFVVPNTSMYGSGRMFETYSELAGSKLTTIVLYDMDEAKEWLGL
jgi:hypothetical protein